MAKSGANKETFFKYFKEVSAGKDYTGDEYIENMTNFC